jgi:AcrR family transcriptional regulator
MTASRSKRSPVPRPEGELRFIRATLDLAREQPFGELRARAIARRADMNHGYVHVWFGSKAALLDAACQYLAEDLRERVTGGELTIDAVGAPDIELMFRLLGRLQTEPGGVELARRRQRPMIDLITGTLTTSLGVDRGTAKALADDPGLADDHHGVRRDLTSLTRPGRRHRPRIPLVGRTPC